MMMRHEHDDSLIYARDRIKMLSFAIRREIFRAWLRQGRTAHMPRHAGSAPVMAAAGAEARAATSAASRQARTA